MKALGRFLLRISVVCCVAGAVLLAPQHLAWGAPETRMSKMLDLSGGAPVALQWPATHLVVQWDGDATATVQVRGQKAGGQWSDWQLAKIDEDGGTSQESGMLILDNAVQIQARVVDGNASNVRATAIDTENGPRTMHLTADGNQAHAMGGLTPQPPIITRAQWGADESLRKGTPEFAPIQRMDVHHTVTANNDPNPAATVRAIYAWHTTGNGWNDIGYNFLIDANGNVYEGRYARNYAAGEAPTGEDASGNGVVGAHTLNHNAGTVGIALLGTFNSVAPSGPQQSALTRLLAWESDRHNLDPMAAGVVLGHRDLYQTECPGDVAYGLLPQWRQQAAALRVLSVPPGNTPGYWITNASGGVVPYGQAQSFGSMAGQRLNAPVISMARTASSHGYWLLGADGGIFSFGDARFFGSTGSMRLNAPIRGMARTPSGNGYWLVAADGGIFSFGDARFFGSTGAMHLNAPVVGMASTPTGNGYWLVATDGGIFSFGDARFYGSTGGIKLNQPVVTIAARPDGVGYWLMARDGGVFAFNTQFWGSIPMLGLRSFNGVSEATSTQTGGGYYMLSNDGGIYTFGDARFLGAGSAGAPAAAISLMPEH